MNALITTLSIARPDLDKSPTQYLVDGEQIITGYQSNDAPAKYVIRKLYKKGAILDKVTTIISRQCLEIIQDYGYNSVEKYKHSILEMYEEVLGQDPDFIHKFVDYKICNADGNFDIRNTLVNYVDQVFAEPVVYEETNIEFSNKLIKSHETDKGIKMDLFFDITGNTRELGSLVTMLLFLFQSRVNGKIIDIISASKQYGQQAKLIMFGTVFTQIATDMENIRKTYKPDITSKYIKMDGAKMREEAELQKEQERLNKKAKNAVTEEKKAEVNEEQRKLDEKAAKTGNKGLMSQLSHMADEGKSSMEKSWIDNICEKENEVLATDFNEEVYKLLVDKKVVLVNEKCIVYSDKLAKSSESYINYRDGYVIIDRKKKSDVVKDFNERHKDYYESVINFVMDHEKIPVIRQLYNQKCIDLDNLMSNCDRSFQYINNAKWNLRFSNQGSNAMMVEEFSNYADSHGLTSRDYVDLSLIQAYYYNHGFPMQFRKKDIVNPQVMNYYRDQVRLLIKELAKMPLNKRKNVLSDKEEVKKRIPKMSNFDIKMFSYDGTKIKGDLNDFVNQLTDACKDAKELRNIYSHDKESIDYSKAEIVAGRIRKYLKENFARALKLL